MKNLCREINTKCENRMPKISMFNVRKDTSLKRAITRRRQDLKKKMENFLSFRFASLDVNRISLIYRQSETCESHSQLVIAQRLTISDRETRRQSLATTGGREDEF